MHHLDLSVNDYGQFMTIIEKCDLDSVEALYRNGMKLHDQMVMSSVILTPIEYLVAKNEYIILRYFYDLGANILGDGTDNQDQKAADLLARAIRNDSLECIEILIEAGTDIDRKSRDTPPVVLSSSRSKLDILFRLIELNANINDDKVLESILNGIIRKSAAPEMEANLEKFLLLAGLSDGKLNERGNDIITMVVNEKLRYDNIKTSTLEYLHKIGLSFDRNEEALKHAVVRANIPIIELLLSFGADPDVMMDKHESLIDYANRNLDEHANAILQEGFLNRQLSKLAKP